MSRGDISPLSPLSLLSVRRGSSDPHEGAARVRRGAGRRHPHGLQRFQLPALRPLLVRDQRREQPVIALPACQRDVSHRTTFFFGRVHCEDGGSVLPAGYVKQQRAFAFVYLFI